MERAYITQELRFTIIYQQPSKDLFDDKNKLKLDLKRYLLHNSFYILEEYFNTKLTIIVTLLILLIILTLITVL